MHNHIIPNALHESDKSELILLEYGSFVKPFSIHLLFCKNDSKEILVVKSIIYKNKYS